MLERGEVIGIEIAIIVGLQIIGYIISIILKTEKLFDFFGSFTFIFVILFASIAQVNIVQLKTNYYWKNIIAVFICIWAIRLGVFLTYRACIFGDARFDEAKSNPKTFSIYWIMQAVWIIVTILPSLFVIHKPFVETPKFRLDAFLIIGSLIYWIGLLLESIADYEMFVFKCDSLNSGQFLKTGLRKYIRYPNYLGEILVWTALFIYACGIYKDAEFLLFMSPIYVTIQIVFVSGIRLQEKAREAKYGNLEDYQEYKKRTNCLCLNKLF